MPRRYPHFSLVIAAALLLGACQPTAPTPTATPPATDTPAATTTSAPPTNTAGPTDTPAPTAVPPTATPLPYDTPAWFKEGGLYQIFVRSFRDSNGDGIGDLDGITSQLDYIQSLGVNTIWLTPIFGADTYHGYDTTDYYSINPDFGTKDDLIELVDAAHARGLHIVLDYVASHTSNQFPYFLASYAQPDSEYSDWYIWKDDKHLTYQSFAGVTSLPTLNHATPAVNDYLIDVAKYWMDLDDDGDYTDGIDGWRCDYALGSPHGFWKQLRSALKPLNPDFLLLGEVWVDDPSKQEPYYEDEFDAQFNFPLFMGAMGATERANDNLWTGDGAATAITSLLDEQFRVLPEQAIPVNFFSNHDTDRLATELSEMPERLSLVPWFLAALPNPPAIYYGEELGMVGHKGGGPIYDEYRREPLDWYAAAAGEGQTAWFKTKYTLPADGISVEEEAANPASLLNTYRTALNLRASTPALRSGSYTTLRINPRVGIIAFWRATDDQLILALFNISLNAATFSFDPATAPGPLAATPLNLVTGQPQALDPAATTLEPGAFLLLDVTP